MAGISLLGQHVWLIVALLLVLGEMLTGGFVLLWFGVGAAIGALVAYLGLSFDAQLVAFGAASLVLFAASRTIFRRVFVARRPEVRTNAEAMIGRAAEVLDPVGPGARAGTVKVGGEVWSAVSPDAELRAGAAVVIEAIDGLKLRVRASSEPRRSARGTVP